MVLLWLLSLSAVSGNVFNETQLLERIERLEERGAEMKMELREEMDKLIVEEVVKKACLADVLESRMQRTQHQARPQRLAQTSPTQSVERAQNQIFQ